MKKCYLLFFILMFGFALAACDNHANDEPETIAPNATEETDVETEPEGNIAAVEEVDEPEVVEDSARLNLEITQFGYSISDDQEFLHYGIEIHNPNLNYDIDFPVISITLFDEDGLIISHDEQTLFTIAANDTVAWGDFVGTNGTYPAHVEVELVALEGDFSTATATPTSELFTISNTSESSNDFGNTYTGTIENLSDEEFTSVAVTILLFQDNEIIYGHTGFVNQVTPGGTSHFDINILTNIADHDRYEISAQPW